MPFWNVNSTTLANDRMYVNNTYKDSNGNSKLTTIAGQNKSGYIPIDANATDPIIKNLKYSIQNDGAITYRYDYPSGGSRQFNSIQEIANDRFSGYTAATTTKIKDSMQRNLTTSVNDYNTKNPTSKVGPSAPASGTNPGAASTSTAPQNTIEDFNKEIVDREDTRQSYRKDLSYPLNRSLKQDYIKFEMLKYEPRSLNAVNLSDISSGGGADQILAKEVLGNRNSTRNSIGTVTLPISSPISDTNTVNWSDDEASTIALQGQALALKLIGGPTSPPTQPDTSTPPPQGSTQTGKLVGYALASAAVGGAGGNLLTRTTGAVVNPNLELLFRGPQLRTFSFTFPMSARSEKESEVIKEIIRFFKQGMSVKRAQGALFLKSPHTFRIKYILADGENKDHPWINMIKECALTNCSVNYTPAGNYATYANGAMTMYEITLNFSELEPVFDDDYAKIDGNAAGKDTMVGY